MGYGEYRPIVPNDSDESRTRNRRVEIYLLEEGSMLAAPQAANVFLAPELGLAFAKATR